MSGERLSAYEVVTSAILEQLERGVRPWMRPWESGPGVLPLRYCGEPYQGINVLMLWTAAAAKGYGQRRWLTFRQAKEAGGNVRKGEHGSPVVYASTWERATGETDPDTGDERTARGSFLRRYVVFNVEQCDGLPSELYAERPAAKPEPKRDADAEVWIAATGAAIDHGGDRAYYSPALDRVRMPQRWQFGPDGAGAYYSTLLHELTHWTGHADRCDRKFSRRFGDEAYALEELVAEIGSAFLCATLSITPTVREDHAGYLAHWLRILKRDNRAILTAASAAQKAADFLHSRAAGVGRVAA